MELKEKGKDWFVTLDLADGQSYECKIMAQFETNGSKYAALLPVIDDKGNVDFSAQIMLYRMEMDEKQNPIVVYIEDDEEYGKAAQTLSDLLRGGN